MKRHDINISEEEIEAFCQRHNIRKLSLFGSFIHGDFQPESDIDILVEFKPGHVPGLDFFSIEAELSELLGHKVDLNTPQFISRYFREKVMNEAEVLFVAA